MKSDMVNMNVERRMETEVMNNIKTAVYNIKVSKGIPEPGLKMINHSTLKVELFRNNAKLYATKEYVYSSKGHLYSSNEYLYGTKGNVYATFGQVYASFGQVYASFGQVYSSFGQVYSSFRNHLGRHVSAYKSIDKLV